ncbi:hypothetical protein LTR10_020439 [Elasticomyces elasticus]|uniref:Cytochrome P450 oxidoreductase n=1 Tax=Exophiala sideris TaxID=1016849 RepID=A0ABR0J3M1_9EURO|nr:hypothetical protein LTR10_020439 [Elasticomyces elasticus]KAK5027036.1 hypothetical protein LTS07_007335 [Exophiala sideris]KAK5034040.1 hypothetical protein LTR13_006640 [Exophiala sideris]KAK5055684.1 hypothetical protein LTR69_008058 [Exophiala sideris]KAK5180982.1 hypothetical protein LTR44_006802 [Eurotiomycetes sp. CCFEE 6388]
MLVSHLLHPDLSSFAWTVALVLVLMALYNRYGHGLNHIPGPAIASFSDLWRLRQAQKRRPQLTHIKLHEDYGSVVRIGPHSVSVSDPEAVGIIYGLNSGFSKSGFYLVQQTMKNGKRLFTLFTATDEKFHAKLRRAVSNAYAMSTLVQFEQYVDSTTMAFLLQMRTRFADRADQLCNFSTWLQWYAFDVIGELTFSKRLGFLDRGEDVEGIIKSIEEMLDYAAVVGQMPFLDNVFKKNPIRLLLSQYGLIKSNTAMVDFARKRLAERVDSETGILKSSADVSSYVRNDFLSKFLAAHQKDPEFITNDRVLALTTANIFAGSDTTAISLRSVIYFLLKHPHDMENLVRELDEQKKQGYFKRDDGMVDWDEVRELPYLSAVIKESLRCHPAAGLTLERITPPQGVTICGQFIPGGTIVGCSAWVLHRDQKIFGERPAEFRPSRWIEASKEHRRLMENSLFTFGAGARTCIGKNISLLEMYKVVPALLMAFKVGLPDQNSEWKLHNAWFVKQSEFYVKLESRSPSPRV